MTRFGILMAAPLLAAGLVAAKSPERLAPVGPWNLHYGESSCQLIRSFGDSATPVTLVLERVAPRSDLTLVTIGGPLRAKFGNGEASAAFLPYTSNRFTRGTIAETVETKLTAIQWTSVNFLAAPREPDRTRKSKAPRDRDLGLEASERVAEEAGAAKITALEIKEPGGHVVILETGSLGRANVMMRQCANDQLQDWGIDPVVEEKIVRPAASTSTRELRSATTRT